MVNKSSFGCDYWEEILPIRVDGIELVGVCTDICVISNALILKPFTRDTFGVAIKATYCEINDVPVMIFKNPKESGFKKSQKGCCLVYEGMDGEFRCADGLTWCDAVHADIQEMNCVFRNGEMVREQTLAGIRELLHGGKF